MRAGATSSATVPPSLDCSGGCRSSRGWPSSAPSSPAICSETPCATRWTRVSFRRMTEPLLEVAGLRTYFYSDAGVARSVDGVSFAIGRGETVGLVGESGCGKSVTALSIMRLIRSPGRIESGSRIRFEGRDLAELPEAEMRKVRGNRIAMIFQEPMTALNPVFTVGDQIGEVARIHEGASRKQSH